MRLTIFGSGYVGLVTGACLADVGHNVLCVDIDEAKVAGLNRGELPIYEPGLEALVEANRARGTLAFTTSVAQGVGHGEVIFIAVGTPADEDGSADLSHVLSVARAIGVHMGGWRLVVDKSTVPVGTADLVAAAIREELAARGADHAFDVCSNPEFLKEGAAIEDFTKAARIVIGAESERAVETMRRVYAPYNRNHDKIIVMDIRSAELTKYAANAMLAAKISFMNEMAAVAERVGADIEMVRIGIGSDPRIGYHFIYPGAGFGGSCFPKDLKALGRFARDAGVVPRMIEAIEAVNDRQKTWIFNTLRDSLGDLGGRTVAIWGLSFKPNTDDMREAPSRVLMEALWASGAQVRAYDPQANEECRRIYGDRPGLELATSPEDALAGADALAICTEWKPFRAIEPGIFAEKLSSRLVVDGRNIFDPAAMREAGVVYRSVGRPR